MEMVVCDHIELLLHRQDRLGIQDEKLNGEVESPYMQSPTTSSSASQQQLDADP